MKNSISGSTPRAYSKILLLPMCGMGDAVYYIPAIQAVRSRYPEALITVVVVSEVARAVLDLAECGVDVVVFNRGGEHRGWRPLMQFLWKIRSVRYDVVISGAHLNSVRVPIFAALSGAKLRIGAPTERCSFVYQQLVTIPGNSHAYDRCRTLLEAIGIQIASVDYVPRLVPPNSSRTAAESLLSAAGIKAEDLLIGIASGADTNARGIWKPALKRWPAARYAQLIRQLSEHPKARLVMFGGKAESSLADEIATLSGIPILNLCGKAQIAELAWLLSWCRVIITNDTGIMHVAAAVGTPLVTLFGPTDAGCFAPRGEHHRHLQGSMHCSPCYPHPTCDLTACGAMDEIAVGWVVRTVTEVLGIEFAAVVSSTKPTHLVNIGD